MKRHLTQGMITAVAHFDDQVDELCQVGVQAVLNFYNEADLGFAVLFAR